MGRLRADMALVAAGLAKSRAEAQAAIAAGLATVDSKVITKPAQSIPAGAHLEMDKPHPWVSRAGIKLAHALDYFQVDVAGLTCLDIGASTGGFTDVLVQAGAEQVFAVDVGQGQLADKLVKDARVFNLEKTDARSLTPIHIPVPIDRVVCDVSFISQTKALPVALSFAKTGASLISLIKPQFEVGRDYIGKGGIVTDPWARLGAVAGTCQWIEHKGWQIMGLCSSPITGGDGNQEYIVFAKK